MKKPAKSVALTFSVFLCETHPRWKRRRVTPQLDPVRRNVSFEQARPDGRLIFSELLDTVTDTVWSTTSDRWWNLHHDHNC